MSILGDLLSPQAMNQEAIRQGNVGVDWQSGGGSSDGFWDKLRAFYESPAGFGQMSQALDYYTALGAQKPQHHYPPMAAGQMLPNPGAITLGNLIQALTGRGF